MQKVMEELKTHYGLTVTVRKVTPLFLGFSLEGVSIQGRGFLLRAPYLLARLSWTKGVSLTVVDGEFSFSEFPSFLSFESLPPFSLRIQRGRFVGMRDLVWDGWFEKSGNLFSLGITAPFFSLRGNIQGDTISFSGMYRASPFRGMFSLRDGSFSGDFGGMHCSGVLSRTEKDFRISPFLVEGKGVRFSGECTFGENALLSLSGVVHALGMEFPLALSGHLALPTFEGDFQSGELSGHLAVDLNTLSFLLALHPDSKWRGIHVSGKLEGFFRDDITVKFTDLSVDVPEQGISFTLEGELKGVGETLRGEVELQGLRGRIGDWEFRGEELRAHLDGKGVAFSGEGVFLGGRVTVSGEYREGELRVLGKIFDIPLEEIMGKEGVPLSGTFSGDLALEKEGENFKLSLSLTDGCLWVQGIDFGRIASGEVVLEKGTVSLRNLCLVRGEGKFFGSLTRDSSGVRGEGIFENYPLHSLWEGKEVRLLLQGRVTFDWGRERSLFFALSAPFWTFGPFGGRDLSLVGTMKGEEVELERLSLFWDGGFLNAWGDLVLGKRVDLQGEVQNLRIPENDFRVSGVVAKARLLLSGPWEDAHWEFEGEGSSLRMEREPLGERVALRLSGRVSLERLLEGRASLPEVLNPEVLEEGIIEVFGVNLRLFGGEFFSKALGTFDMRFTLDAGNKLWRFFSDTITFSFPPYGNFTGEIHGTYDGKCFMVEGVELEGDNGVRLSGRGIVDTGAKSLDIRVLGEAQSTLSFEGFRVSLEGKGELRVFGKWASPAQEGSFYVQRVEVSGQDRTYLLLENLTGKFSGGVLRFSGSQGTFLGGRLMRIEGEVTPEGLAVSGDLDGEGTFPGLEGIFQGYWNGRFSLTGKDGQYTLEGDIGIAKASINIQKGRSQGVPDLSFLQELWARFPISVKLRVTLRDTLSVETDFLRLALSGGMTLHSEKGEFSLEGRFDVVEGTYDLVACTIPLEGYISFTHFGGYMPQLRLEGRKSVGGYDVRVRIDGPLSGYTIDFASEPPLSKEEILSLLFLGDKDAYADLDRVNLSPVLAKVARFFLRGNFALRAEPFFDAVTFDPEDFSRVTLEKRLGKNVTIGYTQNLDGRSSFEVDVDFSKEWSFEFERKESGETEWMLQFTTKF